MGNLLLTDLLLFPNFGKITGSKLERIQIRVYCVCACGSWRYVCYADRSLYAVVLGKETLWLLYKESGVVLSLSHGVRDKKNCFQFLLHTPMVTSFFLFAILTMFIQKDSVSKKFYQLWFAFFIKIYEWECSSAYFSLFVCYASYHFLWSRADFRFKKPTLRKKYG